MTHVLAIDQGTTSSRAMVFDEALALLTEARLRPGAVLDAKAKVGNFVEVKKADTHDAAAQRLSRRQMDRICMAAMLYADGQPAGSLSDIRFDAALVDAQARVEILENAFGLN